MASVDRVGSLRITTAFGKKPLWLRWSVIAASVLIAGALFNALALLFPVLNEVFYPANVPFVSAVMMVAAALIFGAVTGHAVLLSPEGVALVWGPFRRRLSRDEIARAYTLDTTRRHLHGFIGKTRPSISFGDGMEAADFEGAREWMRRFAQDARLEYRQLMSDRELWDFYSRK